MCNCNWPCLKIQRCHPPKSVGDCSGFPNEKLLPDNLDPCGPMPTAVSSPKEAVVFFGKGRTKKQLNRLSKRYQVHTSYHEQGTKSYRWSRCLLVHRAYRNNQTSCLPKLGPKQAGKRMHQFQSKTPDETPTGSKERT